MKKLGLCAVCGKVCAVRKDGCAHSHNTPGTDWQDYQDEPWSFLHRLCGGGSKQAIPGHLEVHNCPNCPGHFVRDAVSV